MRPRRRAVAGRSRPRRRGRAGGHGTGEEASGDTRRERWAANEKKQNGHFPLMSGSGG
jgi:hypothetical protein